MHLRLLHLLLAMLYHIYLPLQIAYLAHGSVHRLDAAVHLAHGALHLVVDMGELVLESDVSSHILRWVTRILPLSTQVPLTCCRWLV